MGIELENDVEKDPLNVSDPTEMNLSHPFSYIGETQKESEGISSKISKEKFMDKSYGLSQYYQSVKSSVGDNLAKDTSMDDNSNVSIDDKENLAGNLTKIGSSSMNGDDEHKLKYSPVLKPSMFVSPTKLPGLDAVYISRLQDGDFTEINENDVDDSYEQIDDYVNKSRTLLLNMNAKKVMMNPFLRITFLQQMLNKMLIQIYLNLI